MCCHAPVYNNLITSSISSRAVRYNMLVNPSGIPGKFRAIDWLVELLNLYLKSVYGGEGSNHTVERIIEESPLIRVFRSSHANCERNFRITGLTNRHAPKNMEATYRVLLQYMADHNVNVNRPCRRSTDPIADPISRGSSMLLGEAVKYLDACSLEDVVALDAEGEEAEETQEALSADDLSIEDIDEAI